MISAITGKNGEQFTTDYLINKGYIIVERNYHSRFGEIDIIAENKEYIVFTEVKTRKFNSIVSSAEAIDCNKQKKIILTAELFLSETGYTKQPRFDAALVTAYKVNECKEYYKLNYIENAF